jgi:hypothetical protein
MRSGNGLAPVQVFHAVPSSPFSAPAELAGLRPGHSKARCVFPSEENLLASRLRSPSPFGQGTMPAPPLHTAFFMTWPSPIHLGSLEGRPICSTNRSVGGSKGVCPIGRRTEVREGEAGSGANVGRGLPLQRDSRKAKPSMVATTVS